MINNLIIKIKPLSGYTIEYHLFASINSIHDDSYLTASWLFTTTSLKGFNFNNHRENPWLEIKSAISPERAEY
ncbi:MAG: hypothetical protein JXB24_15690 [Bacteroidales bacterium]|nr:hypothetical protein [Bacteroidales bacterium]